MLETGLYCPYQNLSVVLPTFWTETSVPFTSTLKVKIGVKTPVCGDLNMGKKLYVGNMSYDVDSSTLEQMFTPFGTVESAQVITDRVTGRSKGFGFVEMGSDEEAQKAIEALNGKDSNGRALTVNEAKPREDRPRTGGGGGGGGGRGGFGGGRSGGRSGGFGGGGGRGR
jgi:RNA recognition motif-containing protein